MFRGKRERQWLVLRRCLAIIYRVQRGPATWKELVQAVLAQEGKDAYGGTEGRALYRRLEKDLCRIRKELMVDLYFDRQVGGYVLRDTWLPHGYYGKISRGVICFLLRAKSPRSADKR
ncbi:MAG: hypothetical protein ACUVV0_13835 [Anaerolineae bacterium]